MATAELVFRAMGDATRRRLLRILWEQELSVSELVDVLEQPQSTISRHLKVLREAGLLMDRRSGPTVLHTVWPPGHSAGNGGPAAGAADGGSRKGGLRSLLLEWVGQEPLGEDVRERIAQAVRARAGRDADFFETVGARWDKLRIDAFGQVFHLEALTSLLPGEWSVADIGTGTGYLLPILASRFRTVIAVDAARAMLDVARQRRGVRSATNVEFREGSLSALPMKTAEVDLAITSLVLHHVEAPQEGLKELRRCLREDGRLLIIEQRPHGNSAFHERMGDCWEGFAPAKLQGWVAAAGFCDVTVRPLSCERWTGRRVDDAPPLFVLTARAGEDRTESGKGSRDNEQPAPETALNGEN